MFTIVMTQFKYYKLLCVTYCLSARFLGRVVKGPRG